MTDVMHPRTGISQNYHMIYRQSEMSGQREFAADICIIGSGAAGLTVAVSLGRAHRSVIVVEAGDLEGQEKIDVEISGRDYKGATLGRCQAFGGTTTMWGGQMLPLEPVDFEDRCGHDTLPGWPISYDELTPYYEQALGFCGLRDVMRNDKDVWSALGLTSTSISPHLELFLSRWLPEPRFNILFGEEIQKSSQVRVLLGCTAVHLQSDETLVNLLKCRSVGEKDITVRANLFIICLGGIESARFLLLQSLFGSRWAANPLIGRCFADHPSIEIGNLKRLDERRFRELFYNVYLNGFKYEPRLRLEPGLLRAEKLVGVGGWLTFESSHKALVTEFFAARKKFSSWKSSTQYLEVALRLLPAGPEVAAKWWNYKFHHRAYYSPRSTARLMASVEQSPNVSSTISLSAKVDSFQQPLAAVDWRIGDCEVSAVQRFADVAAEALASAGLCQVELESCFRTNNREAIAKKFFDQYHHIGSTRMARSCSTGVVDANLKLFGTENVYLCSSSVFPTGGFSNPTHTIIALGLRLVQHLTQSV